MSLETITPQLTQTLTNLAQKHFRFSMIHNPIGKYFQIISIIDPDRIKNKFPEFNISLNASGQKYVELFFYYE